MFTLLRTEHTHCTFPVAIPLREHFCNKKKASSTKDEVMEPSTHSSISTAIAIVLAMYASSNEV